MLKQIKIAVFSMCAGVLVLSGCAQAKTDRQIIVESCRADESQISDCECFADKLIENLDEESVAAFATVRKGEKDIDDVLAGMSDSEQALFALTIFQVVAECEPGE